MYLLKKIPILLILIAAISCSKNEEVNDLSNDSNYATELNEGATVERSSGCPDPCNCDAILSLYVSAHKDCRAFGEPYCSQAEQLYEDYQECESKEVRCPPGFIFDSCNCHSQIYFPDGYTPFIWGNGFYVQQNCEISTANNCCPPGFTFDGANCHYFGTYFDSEIFTPFIWGNSFYTQPLCGE